MKEKQTKLTEFYNFDKERQTKLNEFKKEEEK